MPGFLDDHITTSRTVRRLSRRQTVHGAAALAASLGLAIASRSAAQEATPMAPPAGSDLAGEVIAAFEQLPGRKALKFWAPADAGFAEWSATLNPGELLFCASAFKVFVLAEFLRQAEAELDPASSVPLAAQLDEQLAQELVLDESVFSPSAPVFNPPHLTGKVTARTTLEAMISHSDNTAADMALEHVGPERVRQFIASAGLRNTHIPDSTRQFIAYISGDPNWQTVTWPQVVDLLADDPYPNRPMLNDVITMASTPDDFVAFYSQALQGAFFQYAETLSVFRAILALSDAIEPTMPLGVSAYVKGGSLDFAPDHVLSLAGGVWVPKRWVYFGFMINWTDEQVGNAAEVESSVIAAARTIFALLQDRLAG
jgi:beta-lactamase class A